jgi:hypothetical protein
VNPSAPSPGSGGLDTAGAVSNAHAFFEHNSGWAPPDTETLADWVADGVCRCPDECLVEPRGWCEHGLASWWLVLSALGDIDVPDVPEEPEAPSPAGIPGLPTTPS